MKHASCSTQASMHVHHSGTNIIVHLKKANCRRRSSRQACTNRSRRAQLEALTAAHVGCSKRHQCWCAAISGRGAAGGRTREATGAAVGADGGRGGPDGVDQVVPAGHLQAQPQDQPPQQPGATGHQSWTSTSCTANPAVSRLDRQLHCSAGLLCSGATEDAIQSWPRATGSRRSLTAVAYSRILGHEDVADRKC